MTGNIEFCNSREVRVSLNSYILSLVLCIYRRTVLDIEKYYNHDPQKACNDTIYNL